MIELKNKISVFKPLENKNSKKADIVFNKLLAQQKRPKNPFDEVRSTSYTYANEIKPGEAINDPI